MTQETNSGKARSILGMVIVVVGILVLVPKFIAVAPLLNDTLQEFGLDLFNALPSIGLGALHAGQAFVFHPATFFTGALRILISFWPLLLVTIGTALLRNGSAIWPWAFVSGRASSSDGGR